MKGVTKSKIISIIPLLIAVCLVGFPAYAKYSGGTGEPNDPYQIATAEDLMLLGESTEDYDYYYNNFILIADIDLDPNLPGRKVFDRAVIAPDTNDVESGFQGTPFSGIFDGNGHIISNLTIEGRNYLGLFGQLGYRAKVINLGLDAVDVNGTGDYIGGLVGTGGYSLHCCGGNILNCFSSGMVTGGEYVGGLMGMNRSGIVKYSYSTAEVNGDSYLGGLLGCNMRHWVVNCYSTGAVSGNEYVGGLVGANGSTYYTISPPESILPIEPKPPLDPIFTVDPNLPLGPIFPVDPNFPLRPIDPNIIIGPDFDPGFIVNIRGSSGWIKNCYAIGSVTGKKRFGGLVGQNKSGSVTASFWNIETSGQAYGDSGIGKATAEMQTTSTFLEAGWDFLDETDNGTEDIWWIDEGQDYPRLWWERSTDVLFFLVVDDFESYNDIESEHPDSNLIWKTWIDGFDDPINGSVVDSWTVKYLVERIIIHYGIGSMCIFYDNSGPVTNSEVTANVDHLSIGRDWTIEGVAVLSLWLYGDPTNAPEPMFVALSNADGTRGVVYYDNPNAIQVETWTEWRIDLQSFANLGVGLTNIDTISIGFGNKNNPAAGGRGEMWFDDIRLYRSTSEPAP